MIDTGRENVKNTGTQAPTKHGYNVRFQVIMALSVSKNVIWTVTPCKAFYV